MSNAELAARIQALEDAQVCRADRANADRTRLSTLEQGYNSAVWAFDNGRATFASGDGRFTLAIRARFQADYAGFSQDSPPIRAGFAGPTDLSSGSVVRRAYFGIEGKAYNDFQYMLERGRQRRRRPPAPTRPSRTTLAGFGRRGRNLRRRLASADRAGR